MQYELLSTNTRFHEGDSIRIKANTKGRDSSVALIQRRVGTMICCSAKYVQVNTGVVGLPLLPRAETMRVVGCESEWGRIRK